MPASTKLLHISTTALLCALSNLSLAGTIYVNDANSTLHLTALRATAGFGLYNSHLDQSLGNSLSVNNSSGNSNSSSLGSSVSSRTQGGNRTTNNNTTTRDQSIEAGNSSGNLIVNTISQQSNSGGTWYRFALSYASGVGYAFTTTEQDAAGHDTTASHTLIWSDFAGVVNDGNTLKSRSALNGESATAAPIHALFLNARTTGDSDAYMEWANLAFTAAGQTTIGSLTDGTASAGATQSIMSSTDFRTFDWALTGRIRVTGGMNSALSTRFVVDMTDGSFQHLETVPLPTTAALAGTGLLALAGRRRRMA